jgi:hypothetical protein
MGKSLPGMGWRLLCLLVVLGIVLVRSLILVLVGLIGVVCL